MAFVKMVFYGHNGKSSDIQKNPRLQYQPWQGGVMKGYIDFSADNINYRIERSFGRSNTSDDIAVWNLDSGMKLQLARGRDPGQEFFGLGSEGFEKSVFIGQSGSVINNSGKEDEITQRLLNLLRQVMKKPRLNPFLINSLARLRVLSANVVIKVFWQ
jgi:hypothetical protein